MGERQSAKGRGLSEVRGKRVSKREKSRGSQTRVETLRRTADCGVRGARSSESDPGLWEVRGSGGDMPGQGPEAGRHSPCSGGSGSGAPGEPGHPAVEPRPAPPRPACLCPARLAAPHPGPEPPRERSHVTLGPSGTRLAALQERPEQNECALPPQDYGGPARTAHFRWG